MSARDRSWVVREGDGSTAGEVLSRVAPDDPNAAQDGRLFVGRRRVVDTAAQVAPGDRITVHAPQQERAGDDVPRLLGRAEGLVAAYKPAALPTIPDHRGNNALRAHVARLTSVPEANVHPTSRLDVGVSGVVVFAVDASTRQHVHHARERGHYARIYIAIAPAAPSPDCGSWEGAIGRGPDPGLRYLEGRDATPARTRYAVVARTASGASLLRVEPETGRTHQIRVHASSAGVPLYGDAAYGGVTRITSPTGAVTVLRRIALHAFCVALRSAYGSSHCFVAPVPDELRALWRKLGGTDDAWSSVNPPTTEAALGDGATGDAAIDDAGG